MPRIVPVTLLVASIGLLGGCAQIADLVGAKPQATRDAESGEVTGSGEINVFTLSVGDCMSDTTDAEEVTDVNVVPCDQPHDYEVYYDFSIPDGEWDQEAVYAAAEEGCYNEFPTFVGLSYEESLLDFSYYAPTQQSWDEGNDRIVSCFIGDPSTQTTGSLAGVAR
ncbi:septum formation family protein [Microbacterium sp. cx-59]|uniref:septum formation family protein n=1 Tax=Microbacterium sp. cx-59 TaxID=2891207 RepID=UPI001E456A8F|nr:septum formation family protein [Microbacterium sp. cx-59]MCC4908573.1 septum formation family protein [Microbacterium sp. cx-59]